MNLIAWITVSLLIILMTVSLYIMFIDLKPKKIDSIEPSIIRPELAELQMELEKTIYEYNQMGQALTYILKTHYEGNISINLQQFNEQRTRPFRIGSFTEKDRIWFYINKLN